MTLQLVVGHGHDGQDQVDQVEGAQEDVDHEEEDVIGSGRPQGDLQRQRFNPFDPNEKYKIETI